MSDADAERLLHGEFAPTEKAPGRRWAYPTIGIVFVSFFIAYHTTILLAWNTPKSGLGKRFQNTFLSKTYARRYFSATSNTQSWAMFAPNPNRTNVFIRVLVTDPDGKEWDLGHDIWKKDRHPYWFYDRMGKINRRIDGKKGYQRVYGAWVCREWAEANGGVAPESVRFVKRWTRIPTPRAIRSKGAWGYDPWKLKSHQKEQETIRCATVVNGQLSNEHRARHGFPALEDDGFKPVRIRTWKDTKEAAERRDSLFDKNNKRKPRGKGKGANRNGNVRALGRPAAKPQ